MSHIVQIQTQVRDATAATAACRRLKLPAPKTGQFELFSDVAAGLGIELPDWNYPVVCNLQTGELKFDNFNGKWGKQQELDRFLQAYAIEKAKLEARRKGLTATEQTLSNGSIKLTINVGGAA